MIASMTSVRDRIQRETLLQLPPPLPCPRCPDNNNDDKQSLLACLTVCQYAGVVAMV